MARVCKSCDSSDFEVEDGKLVCTTCGDVQEELPGEGDRSDVSELNNSGPKDFDSGDPVDDSVDEGKSGMKNSEEDEKRDNEDDEESGEKADHNDGEDEDKGEDDEDSEVEYKRRSKKDGIEEDDSGDSDDDNDGDDDDDDDDGDEDADKKKDSEDSEVEGERADKGDREEDESGENDDEDEDDDNDDEKRRRKSANSTVYDFDIMMAKKKEENSRKRRRRGYDIINDNDDIIANIIDQMKSASEADNDANRAKQVATNKLKLLPFIVNQLRKVDLRDAFLDSDVLSVITEWLAPLPDRSLPHLNIRENLLKILIDFNLYDVDRIKGSGIGKAIMYLYKHPKETKENKQRAKQLISAWSRPIFNLDSSFSAISREEREERDKELKRRASRTVDSSDGEGSSQASKRVKETNQQPAKNPGDKGWIPRARVPAPSMRDYVIRPRSKVDGDIGKGSKRPANMLEKLMKTHQERRRANKQQRAINMKIDKL